NNLSIPTREVGDRARSRCLLEESLQVAREAGDRQTTGCSLVLLGILRMIEGDDGKALTYYEESRTDAREVGDPRTMAVATGVMGTIARCRGDLATARARFAESLRIAHALGGHVRLQDFRRGLGCVEILSAEPVREKGDARNAGFHRGTRLFGAAKSLREATGGVIWA